MTTKQTVHTAYDESMNITQNDSVHFHDQLRSLDTSLSQVDRTQPILEAQHSLTSGADHVRDVTAK